MKTSIFNWGFLFLVFAQNAQGVTLDYWLDDIEKVKTGLSLPVKDNVEYVRPTRQILMERMNNIYGRADNEAPFFYVSTRKKDIQSFVKDVSPRSKRLEFYRFLLQKKKDTKDRKMRIDLNSYILGLVDLDALIDRSFSHSHHQVLVKSDAIEEDSPVLKALVNEVRPFMSHKDLVELSDKLEKRKPIELDKDLLPPFGRLAVKNFTHFKGPNCFHAALAFQDPLLPKRALFNAARKSDYHWQMINYDELWRVLEDSFYEINPETTELKYGDILVFFDTPELVDSSDRINYRWLKHAAVYLFGKYTFSKGSKSANSTYTVNTLGEEFRTWDAHTDHLAIKIFRKSLIHVKNLPYADQHDWFN